MTSPTVNPQALELKKIAKNNTHRLYPSIGGKMAIPLQSEDGHEEFVLNIIRGQKLQAKVSYQTRGRSVVVLARLDLGNSTPHRNPDGEVIGSPHIHLYREGFGDKWAFEIKPDMAAEIGFDFLDINADTKEWFDSFLAFCKI